MRRILLATTMVLLASPALSQTVSGSFPARWLAGAADCSTSREESLQVHAYEPQTLILRQGPCAHYEAPFLYLLIGTDRAMLLDTGAIEDVAVMPIAERILALLPIADGKRLPLLVAHTHGHGDHHAGDEQFRNLPDVEIVGTEVDAVRKAFGLADWPEGAAQVDLGGRIVHVMPAPGHEEAHVLFYDERTRILFSGDFLLPGRLIVDDIDAFRSSAARAVRFIGERPVAHVLGAHIERDIHGEYYPYSPETTFHPDERPLQLDRAQLLRLPQALEDFNGFYASHEAYAITNPIHNLIAVLAAILVALIGTAFAIVQLVRRRRQRKLARPGTLA